MCIRDRVTGQALEMNGKWPPEPREIATSDETVSSIILEMSGVSLKGRERVKLFDFFNTLARVEMALGYDKLNGAIALENRYTRTRKVAIDSAVALDDTRIRRAATSDPFAGVVNIITGEHDTGQSAGTGAVPLRTKPNGTGETVTFPFNFTAPAGEQYAITFYLDSDSYDWVQSWSADVSSDFNIPHSVQTTQDMISISADNTETVSYTHLRAHETVLDLVCRLLLEKKKK